MKKLFCVTFLGILCLQLPSYSAQYDGQSATGEPCRLSIQSYDYGPNSQWAHLLLETETQKLDTNIKTPLQATTKKGGECSVIAGLGDDSVVIGQNQLIQRRRFVEFAYHWIQQTKLLFADESLTQPIGIEIMVGQQKFSGPGACHAIDNDELQTQLSCYNLQLVQ